MSRAANSESSRPQPTKASLNPLTRRASSFQNAKLQLLIPGNRLLLVENILAKKGERRLFFLFPMQFEPKKIPDEPLASSCLVKL